MEALLGFVLFVEIVCSVYQLRLRERKIKELENVIKLQMLLDKGREQAIAKLKQENKELRDGNIAIMEHWWDQS